MAGERSVGSGGVPPGDPARRAGRDRRGCTGWIAEHGRHLLAGAAIIVAVRLLAVRHLATLPRTGPFIGIPGPVIAFPGRWWRSRGRYRVPGDFYGVVRLYRGLATCSPPRSFPAGGGGDTRQYRPRPAADGFPGPARGPARPARAQRGDALHG